MRKNICDPCRNRLGNICKIKGIKTRFVPESDCLELSYKKAQKRWRSMSSEEQSQKIKGERETYPY